MRENPFLLPFLCLAPPLSLSLSSPHKLFPILKSAFSRHLLDSARDHMIWEIFRGKRWECMWKREREGEGWRCAKNPHTLVSPSYISDYGCSSSYSLYFAHSLLYSPHPFLPSIPSPPSFTPPSPHCTCFVCARWFSILCSRSFCIRQGAALESVSISTITRLKTEQMCGKETEIARRSAPISDETAMRELLTRIFLIVMKSTRMSECCVADR